MTRNTKLIPAAIIGMCLAACQSYPPTDKQQLVLVHGAHLSAEGWNLVQHQLEQKGYPTLAVNLPGRSDKVEPAEVTLETSSLALCQAINPELGEVTYVAHSQGGAVVNHALSLCPEVKVKRIVYVAAVAPLNGDKPYNLLSQQDEANYFSGVAFDESSGVMAISDTSAFANVFMYKGSDQQKETLLSLAVDEPAEIGEGKVELSSAAYAELDKYYIHTRHDQIISFESQQRIAQTLRLKGHKVLSTGHVPMLTAPQLLANAVLEFVE